MFRGIADNRHNNDPDEQLSPAECMGYRLECMDEAFRYIGYSRCGKHQYDERFFPRPFRLLMLFLLLFPMLVNATVRY